MTEKKAIYYIPIDLIEFMPKIVKDKFNIDLIPIYKKALQEDKK